MASKFSGGRANRVVAGAIDRGGLPAQEPGSGPEYVQTMNTALQGGRDFAPSDRIDAQHVIVFNQTFAKRSFADKDAVGRRVKIYAEWGTIAGVVRDAKFQSLDDPPAPAVYF